MGRARPDARVEELVGRSLSMASMEFRRHEEESSRFWKTANPYLWKT